MREEESFDLKKAGKKAIQEAEKKIILETLIHTRWNRKAAAKRLQISYKALLYKIQEYQIESSTS